MDPSIHRHPAESESGPSNPNYPSSTHTHSHSDSHTGFPRWPSIQEEAEYWEIPPQHFLAQQANSIKDETKIHSSESQRLNQTTRRESFQQRELSPTSSTSSKDSFVTATSPPINPLDTLAINLPDLVGLTTVTSSNQRVDLSALPDTSTLAAADFDVDVRSGFLPPEQPIQRLKKDSKEVKWEEMLDIARALPLKIGGGGKNCGEDQRRLNRRWRRDIREMEVILPSSLLRSDIKYARRAHLVLAFLTHFYIHSQPTPTKQSSSNTTPSLSSRLPWKGYFTNHSNSSSTSTFKNSSNTSSSELDRLDFEAESLGLYASTIPSSLSIPFVSLSNQLGLPPILTYSTTVLWNWSLPNPSLPLSSTNYSIPTTFTNTKDEQHFYATSLLIEIKGVEALKLMRTSLDEAFLGDNLARKRISNNLRKLSQIIKELAILIEEVRKDCDPETFYWGIRPWFRGGDSDPTTDKEEEKGWNYQGVDQIGLKRNYGGPSAGQSSLIHSIDVFLDVDHTRKKIRMGKEKEKGKKKGEDDTFMTRMLDYMPARHRAFLNHLRDLSFDEEDGGGGGGSIRERQKQDQDKIEEEEEEEEESNLKTCHPIRSLALSNPIPNPRSFKVNPNQSELKDDLRESYDEALLALKSMRDAHMRVVASFIIKPSRNQPSMEYAPLPDEFTGISQSQQQQQREKNLNGKRKLDDDVRVQSEKRKIKKLKNEERLKMKSKEEDEGDGDGKQKGTGGTNLISFLKDCVSNTTDAMLGPGNQNA